MEVGCFVVHILALCIVITDCCICLLDVVDGSSYTRRAWVGDLRAFQCLG